MKQRFIFVIIFCGLIASGCGYSLVGQGNLPEHIATIAIPVFKNNTLEEGVEEIITNAVIEEFVSGGKLRLVSESKADAVLSGTIKTYKNKEAVTYDDQNNISSYKLTVTVDIVLKDLVEDETLWETEALSENADYKGGKDVGPTEEKDNENEALRDLAEELAGKIRTLATEGF